MTSCRLFLQLHGAEQYALITLYVPHKVMIVACRCNLQNVLCFTAKLCCRHDRKLKFKGKKAQKKGQKPRNPLNIAFQKSNTKLSKAKSFKKKNKRKH